MTFSEEIQNILKHRDNGSIVFTNGCFDIIHRGHITYLNSAKKLGDKLIVGLNSDASVKRLKGEERPINNQLDRKFVLENLRAVDGVIIFNEDTPLNLIKNLKPDILTKGGDWSADNIVGGKEVLSWGGKVLSLDLVENKSTTNIINKIRS